MHACMYFLTYNKSGSVLGAEAREAVNKTDNGFSLLELAVY